MAVIWKTVVLYAVILLLCGVGSGSARPVPDQTSTNEATSKGFLLAASLTVIATICAVVAVAICTCCDGYEQFPGLSNPHQTPAQTNNIFTPQSTGGQDISSVSIEPLPDVTNLQTKVTTTKVTTTAPLMNAATNGAVSQQNGVRQDWEKFDERAAERAAAEQQPMQPMQSLTATSQFNSHVHDIVDEKGKTCSPIVKQKGTLQQHQLMPLHSTSTPDDEPKQQATAAQHQRVSSRAPPPLQLDDEVSIAPIATPALREAYERNRAAVLRLGDDDIRAIPAAEREERVYQFLTPEEIWALEGRIAASSVKPKPSMAPLDVADVNLLEPEQPAVALSTLSDEHNTMRKALLDLPDGQLAQMPLAEIESFFPYLTAEEILGVQERVRRLQSMQDWSMRTTNDSSQSSSVGRRRSVLTDASRTYLRSLHSTLSVRTDSHGFFIEDDALDQDANSQSAWDVRETVLNADDDSLLAVDFDLLSKAFVYLTPEEIADTQQRVMLVKESRRAMLLAATPTELRQMPAAHFDACVALLDPAEAAAVRRRMEEPDEEEEVLERQREASPAPEEPPAPVHAALNVDEAKANWRLTPNMSLSSSPDPTAQPFDFSTEPPIVQISRSEELLSPDENDEGWEKSAAVAGSLIEKDAQSDEATTPTAELMLERELPLVNMQQDDPFENATARTSSLSSERENPLAVDELEAFLGAEAPGEGTSADVSYQSAASDLMTSDVFSTPSKLDEDDDDIEAHMGKQSVGEETVVGDLIDQVLESAGAEPRTPTRPRSPQ